MPPRKKRRKQGKNRPSSSIEKDEEEEDINDFIIRPIKTANNKIKQPQGAKRGILPEHPFRWYIVGASGSGKSNFVVNMLSRSSMYKNYFHSILVISPTALYLDPTYAALNLPEDNYYPPEEEVLFAIMDTQQEKVNEMGKKNAPRVLVLLDDFISYKKFTNSPILLKFAVMSRHWNISMMLLSQAYHRVPKSIRLQMSAVTYFKGSNKEQQVLSEDFGAPGMSHKAFIDKINYATAEPYNFFFVDLHRPIHKNRYRKNLEEVIISSTKKHKEPEEEAKRDANA